MRKFKKVDVEPLCDFNRQWDKIPKVMKEDSTDINGFKEGYRDHRAIWEIRNTMRKISMNILSAKQAVCDLDSQLDFISAQCSDVGIMIQSDMDELLERINTALPQAIAEAYTPYEETQVNPVDSETFYKSMIEQKEREIQGLKTLLELAQKTA